MATGPQPTVHVATITRSHLHVGYFGAAFSTLQALPDLVKDWKVRTHGPYLDVGRDLCVREFLKGDESHLFFIDSDMMWTPDQIETVARCVTPHTPVVGGLYPNPRRTAEQGDTELAPVCYERASAGFVQHIYEEVPDDPGMWQVDAMGTGFMCIHRNVLEEMEPIYDEPTPWFECEAFGTPPKRIGEDLGFCRRVADIGYPMFVHTGVRVHHFKEIDLTV